MTGTKAEARKPLRLAVIQMARMGDTVQSLMALRAAKQLYPELEITIITHENFSDAVKSTPWIHRSLPFPTEKILAPLLSGEKNSRECLSALAEWLEPLVDRPWDLAINWTFNEPSSYLLGILPAQVKLGFSRKKSGEFKNADGWSHYIQSVVQSSTLQSIHLTDILTTQLLTALQVHYGDPVDPGAASVTSKNFFAHRRDQYVCDQWNALGRRWIALQLGASHSSRAWDPENWAQMIGQILRRHDDVNVVLLGTPRERSLEKRFFDRLHRELGDSSLYQGRVVSKVGTTPFELWTKILSDAQWVFTADTAAIHVASVLGTRVFNVVVDSIRFQETGPYGNGHYVVRNVSPVAAYGAWTYANTEWQHRRAHSISEHFKNLEISQELKTAEIYRAKIRATDEGGGVHYEPLITRPLSIEGWLSQAISHLAREWYCGWVPPMENELSKSEITPDLLQTLRKVREGVDVLDRIAGQGIRTAEELKSFTSKLKSEKLMKSSDRERIANLGQELAELERLITRVGETQLPLGFFTRLTTVLMANLEGEKLSELSRETADSYRFLQVGIGGIRQWVDGTLKLAKPAPVVQPATVIPLRARTPRA